MTLDEAKDMWAAMIAELPCELGAIGKYVAPAVGGDVSRYSSRGVSFYSDAVSEQRLLLFRDHMSLSQFFEKPLCDELVGNPIGVDGEPLCHGYHPSSDGGTWANLYPGALTPGTYHIALKHMFADGMVPTHLMVGPSRRLEASRICAGAPPALEGPPVVDVNPRLVGEHADKWLLVCLSGSQRPLHFRQVGPLRAVVEDAGGGQLSFSVEGDAVIEGGDPRCVYGWL